ncbi:MAG: stringent starvation protein SspA [Arsenophonus sp.]|nr:MAG: stringent starvation protein SspA [Arsenophonus sp.]
MSIMSNKHSIITLFSGETDIYSHQVRIVLAEKGISVEIENIDFKNLPQYFIKINPYRTIPTLVDRELILYDSRIIMEYLDERFPHPPLMPVYPVARGSSRLMMYHIQRNLYSLISKIDKKDLNSNFASKKLKKELLSISEIFKEMPFFMSQEFSLVDCYLAPLLWRLPLLKVNIQENENTKDIIFYMNRIFQRNSFITSLTESEYEMQFFNKKNNITYKN